MGKIYCITGQSRELNESVYRALLSWSEERGVISFSVPDPEKLYNLYLNDYLLNVDWEEYQQLTEQFDDGVLIPIYIGSDDSAPELREYGVFKTYNILFDDQGFNRGMKEILSSEFSYYKDDYDFRKKDEIIDETLIKEDVSESTVPEADKKQTVFNAIAVFLKKRKKIVFGGIAAALCIVIAAAVILSVLANQTNPFYSKGYIDVFNNQDSAYVISSIGDIYTFNGYSDCLISEAIDKQSAIVKTNYNELYYLTKGEYRKITDDVYCAYISNNGKYIYYISKTERGGVLNRYETKSGIATELDDIIIPVEDDYCEMTASPDGKIFVMNIYSDIIGEQRVYNLNNGGKIQLEDVDIIYAITNNGDIYYTNKYGKFIIANKSGDGYKNRDISRVKVENIYFNSDYSEVYYMEYRLKFAPEFNWTYIPENDELYEMKSYIFTENKGAVELSEHSIIESSGENNEYRIKENVSSIGDKEIPVYVYDIDTFRDMHFIGENNDIYKLDRSYTAKSIYTSGDLPSVTYSLSGNGKFIICEDYNKVTAIEKNGKTSILLDRSENKMLYDGVNTQRLYYIGTADNKSVYYVDREEKYLYYKQNGKIKKIYQFSDDETIYYSSDKYAIDREKDIIYFITNGKLYYSKGGGSPVEILTDNTRPDSDNKIMPQDSHIMSLSSMYYCKYSYSDTPENVYKTGYKIYKITDSNELKFICEIN